MGRNLNDIISKLPTERQAKIATLSDKMVEEMIAHAKTLAEFRRAVGKTQVEVANSLGIGQNAVSQLEKRTDTYVSTLRQFMRSLGMTLEFSVVDKKGVRINLQNFLPDLDVSSVPKKAKPVTGVARAAKVRKVGVKVIAKKRAPSVVRKQSTRSATSK